MPTSVILVVEDEPLVRMNAAVLLEDEGYEVIEAANTRAALMVLEQRDGDLDALFTDVDMPGDMNGLELVGVVHRRWPSIALLVTSGVVRMPAALPRCGAFIEKPYSTRAPARMIRGLIQQAGLHQHHRAGRRAGRAYSCLALLPC